MPPPRSVPLHGCGALESGGALGMLVATFTTSTGAVSQTYGPKGFSLGSFTSGVATLSFPKDKRAVGGWGEHNDDAASAADRRLLVVRDVDLTAGTAVVRIILESDGSTDTTHTASTGTLRLYLAIAD